MKALSKRSREILPSSTLAISARAKAMKEAGRDVIDLSIGETDFPTPLAIKEAGIGAIRADRTHYTPASGAAELKRAISLRMEQELGVRYPEGQIFVSSGAKHCLYLALQVLLEAGDEVIYPTPGYVSYRELIRMGGGLPVEVFSSAEEGYKLTPERLREAITPRTKALILNSPCNPTGVVYRREELEGLAEVCIENDLYILSDEIYSSLVYDQIPFVSLASLGPAVRERLILVNGVSKAYAMTGWRIGYALAEPEVIQRMSSYASHSTGSPCSISQWAAIAALNGSQEETEKMRRQFERRRDLVLERIKTMPGVTCRPPEGAFYVFLDIRGRYGSTPGGRLIRDDETFAAALLEERGLAVVPGSSFGGAGHVRLSYAAAPEQLEKGMDRLEKFLRETG